MAIIRENHLQKICIFTGTRAEYGLLQQLMAEISKHPLLSLQLLVSGTHLSPEFGMTFREIEQAGFHINEKVEMLMSSDSSIGVCKSMGLGMIGFSEALDRLHPDILVVLGDRYEAFSVAAAAMISRIASLNRHCPRNESTCSIAAWPLASKRWSRSSRVACGTRPWK